MKPKFTLLALLLFCINAISQIPITAVSTSVSAAPSSRTYLDAGKTYNWGLSPNNGRLLIDGFTAGGTNYGDALITGNVKFRRVNNPGISGNFTLVWSEAVTAGSTYNIVSEYPTDMESFFTNRFYNQGTDNLFDNTATTNKNNIERMDWILTGSYAAQAPAQVGFGIFERGNAGGHDPFCIAAITSLDGSGNPASYGNIVRVAGASYGDPGPSLSYRILKALNSSNLLTAGTGTQGRGGVFISLQNLGITAGQTIYGYSLFANDLPLTATPADLVDYTNATFFPTATNDLNGGLDFLAVTGLHADAAILPTRFISFSAVENHENIGLKWNVENETSVSRYVVERSDDGKTYSVVGQVRNTSNTSGANAYSFTDNVASVSSNQLYYRIKQYDHDGAYYFSKTIVVRRNNKNAAAIIYPNPAKENLFVSIASTTNEQVKVFVVNSGGSQVIAQKMRLFNGNNSFAINGIDMLPTGVYNLSINWPSGRTITQQFVKH